jgi:hypothetical protein
MRKDTPLNRIRGNTVTAYLLQQFQLLAFRDHFGVDPWTIPWTIPGHQDVKKLI